MKSLTQIRKTAISKANRLQRCHRHLDQLAPAFAEWADGEIYVCKKTGTYRYRFGAMSKSVTPWDKLARSIFPTPADFAFAATVLHVDHTPSLVEVTPRPAALPAPTPGRVNVLALAQTAAA